MSGAKKKTSHGTVIITGPVKLNSPSSVANVMYQKYVNSMPLYRQEKDWENLGIVLSAAQWPTESYVASRIISIQSSVICGISS